MDKAKIIERLQKISGHAFHTNGEDPFIMSLDDGIALMDAVTLLKEQEPIQMKISEDYGLIKFGECPKCKSFINNRYFPKSCGCGQAVKWNADD